MIFFEMLSIAVDKCDAEGVVIFFETSKKYREAMKLFFLFRMFCLPVRQWCIAIYP